MDSGESSRRPIVTVTGQPGVGKTAFAVALACSVEGLYPDGCHLIDVGGDGEQADELDLVDTLSTVLDGGVARPRGTRTQLIARLRVMLSGKQILVVLDNVPSETMLDELLAVSDSISVICTSRARLTGLGIYQPRMIEIEPLAEADGSHLAALTAPRLTDADAQTLATICGGLPLAVLIASAYIQGRPHLDVQEYMERLNHPDSGMHELTAGKKSMAAIIETSYRSLSENEAQLFRALGILPNAIVTVDLIASATGQDADQLNPECYEDTRGLLDDLFELNLIQQPEPNGYRLHSVLYRFARTKVAQADAEWRHQAIRNSCLMYAARLRHAGESIGFIDTDAATPAKSNAHALSIWEKDSIGARVMVESACRAEDWDAAQTLANILFAALQHLSRWEEMDRVARCIRTAGEATGNHKWTTRALLNLGLSAEHRGNLAEATELYQKASDIAADQGDHITMMYVWVHHGGMMIGQGYLDEGISLLRRTLPAWRSAEDDGSLAQTLQAIGGAHLAAGRYRSAEQYVRNSMAVARRAGFGALLPRAGLKLAAILRSAGQHVAAHHECVLALERARSIGSRSSEAAALLDLGISGGSTGNSEDVGECISAALQIYRDTQDVTGQVTALRLRGHQAKDLGDMEGAAQGFAQSADLALVAGDHAAAAQAFGLLGSVHGLTGNHEVAKQLFADAAGIATAVENDHLEAEVQMLESFELRRIGATAKSIVLLRKLVRTLAKRGPSQNLANAKTLLGEALLHDNQWEESGSILGAVAESPAEQVGEDVQAKAFRFLAVLYSKRKLWHEAQHAGLRALSLSVKIGLEREKMECHITLGNVYARMGLSEKSMEQYDLATPIAEQRRDVTALMIIAINGVNHALASGNANKEPDRLRKLIEMANTLGNPEMAATIHLNLGSCLASAGEFEAAIAEITAGREIARSIEYRELVGRAESLLANIYGDQGNKNDAANAAKRARVEFESYQDWPAAAAALRHELTLELNGVDTARTLEIIQSMTDKVPAPVQAALRSALDEIDTDGATALVPQDEHERRELRPQRRLSIADDVRTLLNCDGAVDVTALCQAIATDARRTCFVCGLRISPTGNAEVLALVSSASSPAATLAHSACSPSSIIRMTKPTKNNPTTLETECVRLAQPDSEEYLPAIVVDCIGGRVIGADGLPANIMHEVLRQHGFAKITGGPGTLETPEPKMLESGTTALQARLVGKQLSIHYGDDKLCELPLMFNPDWYREARVAGFLVAMFGTNLEGSVVDNPHNIVAAAQLGNLIGAIMDLTVVTPARNKPCVCETPGRRKFRHCCGRQQ